jgi:hypothetical protein
MSNGSQEKPLDRNRARWQDAIWQAKAKVANLKRAIAIFDKNMEEGVPFPKRRATQNQRTAPRRRPRADG